MQRNEMTKHVTRVNEMKKEKENFETEILQRMTKNFLQCDVKK